MTCLGAVFCFVSRVACVMDKLAAKAILPILLVLSASPALAVQTRILPQGSSWPIPAGWRHDSNGGGQPEPPARVAMSYLPKFNAMNFSGFFPELFPLQSFQSGITTLCSQYADRWNSVAHGSDAMSFTYSAWDWDSKWSIYGGGNGGDHGPAISGYTSSGFSLTVSCAGTLYWPTTSYCLGSCTGTRYRGEFYACGLASTGDPWCHDVLPPALNDERGAGSLYSYCPVGYQEAHSSIWRDIRSLNWSSVQCALQNPAQVKKPSDGVCTVRIKSLAPYLLESDNLDPDCRVGHIKTR